MRHHLELTDTLAAVRQTVRAALSSTSMRGQVARFGSMVGGGKMLRTRLILRIGAETGVRRAVLVSAGAAVEMLHAASLLHDDVVDGGTRRRGEPALWVSDGARAAVLLGDLLVSLAMREIQAVLPAHTPRLIETLHEMCDAEAEQEFTPAAADASWRRCVGIARRKTGRLFGFAAACAAGGDSARIEALDRAGTALGTAYQLADDLLDAAPFSQVSDKSMGTDAATGKLTAASASLPVGVAVPEAITALLRESLDRLARWPAIQSACRGYIADYLTPLVKQYTVPVAMEAAS